MYSGPLGLRTYLSGINGSATVLAGGQGTLGIYFNPGLGGQPFALGVYSSQGGAAGFNLGAGVFGGVLNGDACKLRGNTIDTNAVVGPVQASFSVSPDDGTTSWIAGYSAGIPGGGSASYSHTEAFGVEDIGPAIQGLLYSAINNAVSMGVAQQQAQSGH